MTSFDQETLAREIGDAVYKSRQHRGYSLFDLARVTGCTISMITAIEAGVCSVTVLQLTELARALGVSPAVLLPFERPEQEPELLLDQLPDLRQALTVTLGQEVPEGSVITGYGVIAEWSSPQGERWLSQTYGDINDEVPAQWTVEGWLYRSLREVSDGSDDESEQ